MAKFCFYCGKELKNGNKCDCTTRVQSANKTSTRNKSTQKSREKKQRAKAKKATKRNNSNYYNSKSKTSFFDSILKFMTNQHFDENAPLHKKLGYSMAQSFLRPIAAIDSFVYSKDFNLSIIYIAIFSLVSGLVGIKIVGPSIIAFLESAVLSIILLLVLNTLVLLSFRFLIKIKFRFIDLLSTLSVPLVFSSIFFLISIIGRVSIISLSMTIISGIIAFNIFHFIGLKRFSGVTNEQLAVNFILIYFVFLSIVGFVFNLILSPIIQ